MSDKKLTDKEIVNALECCLDVSPSTCKNCPLFNITNSTMVCSKIATKFALDLITRQQAEIERLKGHQKDGFFNLLGNCLVFSKTLKDYNDMRKGLKSEAVKDFAERMKGRLSTCVTDTQQMMIELRIDNLVKEMVGDSDV